MSRAAIGYGSDDSLVVPRSSLRTPLLAIVGVIALGIVGVAAFLIARAVFTPSAGVSVVVRSTPQGEALEVTVPDAAPGTKVRFGGQEQPLQSTRAMLPLPSGGLRVGDNDVALVSSRRAARPRSVTSRCTSTIACARISPGSRRRRRRSTSSSTRCPAPS